MLLVGLSPSLHSGGGGGDFFLPHNASSPPSDAHLLAVFVEKSSLLHYGAVHRVVQSSLGLGRRLHRHCGGCGGDDGLHAWGAGNGRRTRRFRGRTGPGCRRKTSNKTHGQVKMMAKGRHKERERERERERDANPSKGDESGEARAKAKQILHGPNLNLRATWPEGAICRVFSRWGKL